MRIGILHGYELTGSGSNEYTRYLARELARQGHDVHIFCREPGELDLGCTIHRLPHARVRPVYVTDKQREGQVKAFPALTDDELREYHQTTVEAMRGCLPRLDILHANHLVWQPSVAAQLDVPFVVFPHGSSIEYTVRVDTRYREAARAALVKSRGVISGSEEVLGRIRKLYPQLAFRHELVGVGVDSSLFTGVGNREALAGRFGGKTRAQSQELRARLDVGDYDAINDYRTAYDHREPDEVVELPARFVLFVGALTAGKGVQNMIAAEVDCDLVVVGSGAYREALEALAHALTTDNRPLFDHICARGFDLDRSGLSGPMELPYHPGPRRVHFVGRLNHDRLRHLFPLAELAVFPSVFPEAYPLVLMESLANGVLPVVSDFSGFADGLRMLEPLLGKDLIDRMRLPLNVDGISTCLKGLLSAPPDRSGLRAIAVEHFDWSVRARQMVEAYSRLLE